MRDEGTGDREYSALGSPSHPPSLVPRPSSRTYWDALAGATERLEDATESPQLDAELLLRQATGLDRTAIFMRYGEALPGEQLAAFQALVERRAAGEPIAYILGRRWFRTIELLVDERVLVPRPETERLVEYALAWLKRHPGPRRVIDVGTGSGAIALALATELGRRTEVEIVAVDVSPPAVELATLNRDRLGLGARVVIQQSDLLADVPGSFDIVLANLPYLRPDQRHPSTRLEPEVALFGGPDGFDLHRRLLIQAAERLSPSGLYAGEIDPAQAEVAVTFAREATGREAWVAPDYSGDARYLLVGSGSACR
jgi:release factor glutamine methyltransferase